MSEYREIYPTCPECLNESLIIVGSSNYGEYKNWFKCVNCGYQEGISINLSGVRD